MREICVGIIGAGVISHRHMTIYENIQRRAREFGVTAKVVAVSEVDEKKLKAWAARYGIDEKDCYTDFREMLKRDDIDTVDVCAHNNLHAPLSVAVMRAGKGCYCEKPMAGSYADTVLMRKVAEETGAKFAVQISSIMTGQTRMAKKMIEDGELGKVFHARTNYLARRRRPGLDLRNLSTDFYSSKIGGHGPLFDLGVYHISQMLYVMGMPELKSVYGSAYTEIGAPAAMLGGRTYEVEESAFGMAKFEGGLSLEVSSAWAVNMEQFAAGGDSYITGSKGSLKILGVDCGGGALARPGGAGGGMGGPPGPRLSFYGNLGGHDVDADLRVADWMAQDLIVNPRTVLFNDNQVHWLNYFIGEISDEERINTPAIAQATALLSEGIFLSDERGESVTAEEIKELSVSTALWDQETPWGVFHYDE